MRGAGEGFGFTGDFMITVLQGVSFLYDCLSRRKVVTTEGGFFWGGSLSFYEAAEGRLQALQITVASRVYEGGGG